MKAIVLAGGGAKGAYQFGAWKALRKLNIKYDIVTGTSIGSVNGALMTQNSFRKARKLWKSINNDVLYDSNDMYISNLALIKLGIKNIINNDGLNSQKLENIIMKNLDLDKFYNSKINFGLVALNLSDKKSAYYTKKDIKKEKLYDYLIASCSCYPAFKSKEIDGHKYIDGGYYDNLPINLAIQMGADEIIAIDLKGMGFKKIPKKRIKTTVIKPNNKLCDMLDLSQDGVKKNTKYGYNDTMKVLNKYEGKKYTFKKHSIEKITNKYIDKYIDNLEDLTNHRPIIKKLSKTIISHNSINQKLFRRIIEDLGTHFNIDDTKIYNYRKFNKLLKKNLKLELKNENTSILIKKYQQLSKQEYEKVLLNSKVFPYEILKVLYLYTITKR